MHFILTRKLKFLLQRGHQITSKSICPLSLFLSPDCRPSAISSPLQTNHNHRGEGTILPRGRGARWPPHIYPITHAEALFCGQEQFILTMDVFIMRNFISIILRNFHNYFVDVYFEEKRFSVVWSGFILRRPWNGAATHSPLGTLAATCPSCRQ